MSYLVDNANFQLRRDTTPPGYKAIWMSRLFVATSALGLPDDYEADDTFTRLTDNNFDEWLFDDACGAYLRSFL